MDLYVGNGNLIISVVMGKLIVVTGKYVNDTLQQLQAQNGEHKSFCLS
jgi:hypothetical protein